MSKRMNDRARVCAWAAEVLQRPDVRILDTETTGLRGARLCQIAIIDLAGATLLDTLVNPERAIEPGARRIHGITDAMVTDAPTFAALAPQLTDLLHGKTALVYNANFDRGVLLGHTGDLWDDATSDTWIGCIGWLDLMVPYAAFCGEWNTWHQDYKWQPLPGGDHTAVGDCLAALAVLRRMAAEHVAEVVTHG